MMLRLLSLCCLLCSAVISFARARRERWDHVPTSMLLVVMIWMVPMVVWLRNDIGNWLAKRKEQPHDGERPETSENFIRRP